MGYRDKDECDKRFWRKVRRSGYADGCWFWTGRLNKTGYGLGSHMHARSTKIAHRIAWIITNGEIPDGMCVCHKCDVRCCVRPDHLFIGTRTENMQDYAAKSHIRARNSPIIESKEVMRRRIAITEEFLKTRISKTQSENDR